MRAIYVGLQRGSTLCAFSTKMAGLLFFCMPSCRICFQNIHKHFAISDTAESLLSWLKQNDIERKSLRLPRALPSVAPIASPRTLVVLLVHRDDAVKVVPTASRASKGRTYQLDRAV